ncbi:hypothetical protein PybrP1_005157, partial [[Pythium] brassicae (nom. inval.)]
MTQQTQYGTSSLESDDSLRNTTDRRRRAVKWAAATLVVSAGVALVALSTFGSASDNAAPVAAITSSSGGAAAKGGAVKCWQSSYINGEKKMMEPITTGLEWKKKADGAKASSFIAFGRVPMGSSDYGLTSYSFNDVVNDTTMSHFDTNVTHDTKLADFIANHLGPVIKRDHPDVKVMVFDHNRDGVQHWAETIFRHEGASKYVDGIAFHWYDGQRYMDGVEFHDRLNDTHYVDESRFMLATESCNCPEKGGNAIAAGDEAWMRAQRYGHDILTDINNWAVGWVDWNLILDHTGGPNHLGNNCDAPIIIDETEKDYFIQPMYYFIQHFSKFVPSGSRRVHTDVSATFKKAGDAQLFVRYPAALHSCDSSARQAIHVTEDSKLQVTGTPFCLILVNDAGRAKWVGPQIELVECQYTTQTWTFKD